MLDCSLVICWARAPGVHTSTSASPRSPAGSGGVASSGGRSISGMGSSSSALWLRVVTRSAEVLAPSAYLALASDVRMAALRESSASTRAPFGPAYRKSESRAPGSYERVARE
eukprot:scaffold1975_cov29-Tisochrysis_lutea.AAC.2